MSCRRITSHWPRATCCFTKSKNNDGITWQHGSSLLWSFCRLLYNWWRLSRGRQFDLQIWFYSYDYINRFWPIGNCTLLARRYRHPFATNRKYVSSPNCHDVTVFLGDNVSLKMKCFGVLWQKENCDLLGCLIEWISLIRTLTPPRWHLVLAFNDHVGVC